MTLVVDAEKRIDASWSDESIDLEKDESMGGLWQSSLPLSCFTQEEAEGGALIFVLQLAFEDKAIEDLWLAVPCG